MSIDKMVDSAKLDREMLATANAIRTQGKTEEAILWEDEIGFEQAVLAIKGGGGLNFEVVGETAQPENPKENTIWVNTDQEITGWVFSANEPTAPAPGIVWIKTSRTSSAEFSVAEDHVLMVYPVAAKQYNGGAWTPKDAMSYLNGMWVSWATYLFKNGDPCSDVTSGWGKLHSYSYEGTDFDGYYGIVDDGIKIGMPIHSAGASWQSLEYATKGKVDLTDFDTLSFRLVESHIVNVTWAEASLFGVFNGTSDNLGNMAASLNMLENTAQGYYEIPITKLTGSYYIGGRIAACDKTTTPSYYIVDEISLR